jgi:syndecan 4
MQRLLILIVALSLVIGTQSVCPLYKGKKCGGTQSHTLRGKTFDAKHGECVQNGDKEECECETGFNGLDCGTHGCSAFNDCTGENHGTCIDIGLELQNPDVLESAKDEMLNISSFPYCKCKSDFTGATCAEKTCKDGCVHGTCLNGVCHCSFGYVGAHCDQPACGPNTEKPTTGNCVASGKCAYLDLPIGTGGCSNHGVCTMPRDVNKTNVHCVCNTGYEGVLCERLKEVTDCPSLFGNICSGNGNCERIPGQTGNTTHGVCVCTSGFKGKDCSERICKDDCNSAKKQGVCDSRLRACVCKKGFTGESCGVKDCGGTIRKLKSTGSKMVTECSGHGTCNSNADGTEFKCLCDENHMGDDCSELKCPNNCNGERGECKADGNEPKSCHCKKNSDGTYMYSGPGCAILTEFFCHDRGQGKDLNCDVTKNKCSTGTIHTENQKCSCAAGFSGDRCEIHPCDNTAEGHPQKGEKCSGRSHGTCMNNKKCKCNPGYVGPKCGRTCPKLNGKTCSEHGECVVHNQTHGKCDCTAGWKGEFCETPACEVGRNALGDMEECSGLAKGMCVKSKCYCRDGWMQGNCERPVCPGDCNGHGRCNAKTSRCHCEHGWTGESCNLQECCDPNCSGNGQCNNGTCICNEGWFGLSCGSKSPHKPGSHNCQKLHNCYKHGECDEAGNKCICELNALTNKPLWRGKFCEIPICHKDCSNHGKCGYSSNGLRGVCNCDEGYYGDHCQRHECPYNCSTHGYCLNGTCFCHPGFTGYGCEKKACPNSCSGHGICGDGGLCACVNGFHGLDCSQKPCPGHSQDGPCSGHGTCDNGVCKCVGYHQTPFNDEPMWIGNDCGEQTCPSGIYEGATLKKNACSNKGICSVANNTKSECSCEEGYGGDGCHLHTCKGWGKHLGGNKYQFKTEKCNNRGKCVEERGNLPKCECERGFTGPICGSHSCDWDFEKKVELPNCHSDLPVPHGICTNGSCYCHTNFTGAHCELAACKACAEIDMTKCLNSCSQRGKCRKNLLDKDHVGEYKCYCDANRYGEDCSQIKTQASFKAISALVHPVHGKPCESSCRSHCGSKSHLDKTHARSCIWSCENKCVSKGQHGKLKDSHVKLRSQF